MKLPVIKSILLLTLIVFTACKKNESPVIVNDAPNIIHGKIIDDSIYWKINHSTVQPVTNFYQRIQIDKNNSIIQRSAFGYEHNSRKPVGIVKVISPAFDVKASQEIKKMLFASGMHEFSGGSDSSKNGFALETWYNNEWYSTAHGLQENKSFEIIDTEYLPYQPNDEKYILARSLIRVNCNLYTSDKIFKGEIKDLLMHAEFLLEKE